MTGDELRNEMILKDIRQAVADGRSPIVLTELREHLDLLAERLAPHVRNVVVFRGGMGARQRASIAEQLTGIAENEERVLLSTGRYLGEGFDDPRLDTLFLTMPISWRGTLARYAGRLHRLQDSMTEVVIYDNADLKVPMLTRMHERRRSGYRAIGYQAACFEATGAKAPGDDVAHRDKKQPARLPE